MKKVLWVSQHPPLPRQIARLNKLFGKGEEIGIVRFEKFASAESILERFREVGAIEMVVVAPLSVIDHICRQGIKPLWAEMEPLPSSKGSEASANGRHFRFNRFRRIKKLALEFEPDFDDGQDSPSPSAPPPPATPPASREWKPYRPQ